MISKSYALKTSVMDKITPPGERTGSERGTESSGSVTRWLTLELPKIISLGRIELIVRAGLRGEGVGFEPLVRSREVATIGDFSRPMTYPWYPKIAKARQYITRKEGDGAVMGPDV